MLYYDRINVSEGIDGNPNLGVRGNFTPLLVFP